MPRSLGTFYFMGKNSDFNLDVNVQSFTSMSGPTWGKVKELEKLKGPWQTQLPAASFGFCSSPWHSQTALFVLSESPALSLPAKALQGLLILPSSSFQSIK